MTQGDLITSHIAPASHAAAVVKSDSANHTFLTSGQAADAIFVGGAGDIVIVTAGNETVTLTCPAGILLPIRSVRVNSTNTTATNMFALWS